jgi:FkbM family methyltransferase
MGHHFAQGRRIVIDTIEYNGRTISFDGYGKEHIIGGEGPIMAKNFLIRPGQVFFDVGAGDSSWTLYALASGAAKVYAFEPSLPNYKKLVQDVLVNEGFFERSRLLNVGCDRYDCVKTLADWYTHIGGDDGLEITPDCKVPVRFLPIDHYLPELTRLDWIKMDIEGGEYDAILGGIETIKKFRPNFIIENHEEIIRIGPWMKANRVVPKIYELLGSLGYWIFEDTHVQTAGRSFIIAVK